MKKIYSMYIGFVYFVLLYPSAGINLPSDSFSFGIRSIVYLGGSEAGDFVFC